MTTQRSHIHATDAVGIKADRAKGTSATPAQMATVILSVLKRGPLSETDLLRAIRDAGYVHNLNTFTLAVGWLRQNRGLVTKTARPKGKRYSLEGSK